jgi:hypothetical protein
MKSALTDSISALEPERQRERLVRIFGVAEQARAILDQA